MKELPILFSTQMVQALLAGRKTMTRRVLNPQPTAEYFAWGGDYPGHQIKVETKEEAKVILLRSPKTGKANFIHDVPKIYNEKGAKYQIGDLLWVKETYCPTGSDEYLNKTTKLPFIYKADFYTSEEIKKMKETMKFFNLRWRPSRFMIKSAARIWLKVTDVKVERLQDISKEDAIAEGIKAIEGLGYTHYTAHKRYTKSELEEACPYIESPILSFLTLWEYINGEESLNANPWVFAYTFEIISTKGKPESHE